MISVGKCMAAIAFFICLGAGLFNPAGLASAAQNQEKAAQPLALSGGVSAGEPRFRLIRAVAGTRGTEQDGKFEIEDGRTVFYVPADQKVIVYFEWEGPLGNHHFEGFWKNPEGKIAVMSDFSYAAKERRFGAYWTLMISGSLPTGLWALEAHVDGEVAGVQTFQIVAGPPAPTNVRKLPSRAEIYKMAMNATVDVQRLSATGDRVGTGSAFAIEDGILLTTYDVIDCASSVRVVLPGGKLAESLAVLASDRLQNWALLKAPTSGVTPLQFAKPGSWSVGDEYFSLDVPASGGHTLIEGSITGINDFPDFGKRVHLSISPGPNASGAPVLNEAGKVIGIMSRGSLLPGVGSFDNIGFAYPANLEANDSPARLHDVLAVPITALRMPAPDVQPIPIAEFIQAGGLIPPLATGYRIINRGTIARKVVNQGVIPETEDERFQYSRRDRNVMVFLSFLSKEKVRSEIVCRLYDLNNHLLREYDPVKLRLDPSKRSDVWWPLEIGTLPDGFYRVDIIIGGGPAWRTFFRIAA